MSTGLTWLFILDVTAAVPDHTSGPIQFNDYNEARSYCEWFIRAWNDQHGNAPWIYVYTTSPNQDGWYAATDTFIAFD
jgi:hypothetical protein